MATPTPAWKRLGLKLKYAKDESDRPSTAVSTKTNLQSSEASERPAKRRRFAKYEPAEQLVQNGTQSSSSRVRESEVIDAANGSGSLSTDSHQPIQRKKSVTFSDETKQDDGDSRTTIDFPAGSPGAAPKKVNKSKKNVVHSPQSESPETLTSASDNTNLVTASPHTKPTEQASIVRTDKRLKASKTSTKNKASSALDYLHQHRLDHDSWKFNKILDVWILSHAFDTQAIPSSHLPALAGYVRGLPEKAGSRLRLLKECRDALSTSQLEADSIEADRTLFIEFLDSKEGPLEDATGQQDFLQSHSRATILLWALNEVVEQSKVSAQSSGQGVFPVKKKKSRTSAPIDISSSSESDSEGDSSSDSSDTDEEATDEHARNVIAAVNRETNKNDTSSSGTSSSDDESEDSSSSDTPSSNASSHGNKK